MRLLIAEKPHFARVLREHNLIDPDIEVVFTFGIGLWRYAVPRECKKICVTGILTTLLKGQQNAIIRRTH